ncbi:MAG: riboflavin synthase, partial [Chloroflexi bacterium]|nr:riboflavin synthase [Chloroflexota bacterium]
MFTGIVEEIGTVRATGPNSLSVAASIVLEGVRLGDSIAVNGVCLTVTAFDARSFTIGLK